MRRTRVALPAALALGATTLTGCAAADPAAVVAVGLDEDGYLAVVQMCDQGRTFTSSQFELDDGAPALGWIGRTVEPITFFRVGSEPPDNWVVDVDGGLVSGVEYRFAAIADDLTVRGPVFTVADLNALQTREVIDAAGTTRALDDFLDHACSE